MKTKVVFCTWVKRKDHLMDSHLRRGKSKIYQIDKYPNITDFITIEDVKYRMVKLMWQYDHGKTTQEIWVIPLE